MNLLKFPFSGYLYNAEQTRCLDHIATSQSGVSGFSLMCRAGESAYHLLQSLWPEAKKLVILCGSGNNGGDGLVVAALAAQAKADIHVYIVGGDEAISRLKGEALDAYEQAIFCGVNVESYDVKNSRQGIEQADVIVDALLGTGLQGDVRADYQEAINAINASTADVLAIDVPSGICSDTGRVLGVAVQAKVTLSFIGLKRGLMTHEGLAYRGQLLFDALGVEQLVYDQVSSSISLIEQARVESLLPPRPVNSHKGSNGHLLVIAGGEGMAGAGLMAAEAALCVGAGLVTLATRPDNVLSANVRCPEVMARGVRTGHDLLPLLDQADVVLIGPGLGQGPWSEQLLQQLVRYCGKHQKPTLWDADALNMLASHRSWQQFDAFRIITPHPGEAARLLNISTADVQADRYAAVKNLQARYGGIAMLKGAGSLVNNGEQTQLCQFGNPGMATGGMGDVLSGIIGSLRVQGLSAFEATSVGIQLHANAADYESRLNGERGLRATSLFKHLGKLSNPQQFVIKSES